VATPLKEADAVAKSAKEVEKYIFQLYNGQDKLRYCSDFCNEHIEY
jgi:hypothetical protein